MKKLKIDNDNPLSSEDFIVQNLRRYSTRSQFEQNASSCLSDLKIEFYEYVGVIFKHIGFVNPHVTREGDVNCRFDATLIDDTDSIPIEIKSPREDRVINIKAIRQALENKIVLLSRGFFPTRPETTSLAIAFDYPASRSDVYELVDDIKNSFGYHIGLISIHDLLFMVYDIRKEGKKLNKNYFNTFYGKLKYEKAITSN